MRIVALGATPEFKFTTRRSDTGAPTTLAGTPVISVYEEANLTEITAGVTLTADYDSRTGFNRVTVAATSGNGYEAGKIYHGVITTGTVNTVSAVGETVFEFRIETVQERALRLLHEALYPSGVEITTTTSNSTTAINLTDIVDAQTPDDALIGLELLVFDATDGRIEFVETTACTSLVATVARVKDGAAMSFTVAAGDYVVIINTSSLRPTTNGRKLDVSAGGEAGLDWANVGSPTTTVALSGTRLRGTIAGTTSGAPSTTSSNTDLSGYADDELIGRTIIFTSGTADGQSARITDYANTSGVVTYTTLTTAPAASDGFVIV